MGCDDQAHQLCLPPTPTSHALVSGEGASCLGEYVVPLLCLCLTRREPVRSAGCVVVAGCRDCGDLGPQARQAPERKREGEKESSNPARRVGISSRRAGGLTPDQPGAHGPLCPHVSPAPSGPAPLRCHTLSFRGATAHSVPCPGMPFQSPPPGSQPYSIHLTSRERVCRLWSWPCPWHRAQRAGSAQEEASAKRIH